MRALVILILILKGCLFNRPTSVSTEIVQATVERYAHLGKIGRLIDTTFNYDSSLNHIYNFKSIDTSSGIHKISQNDALQLLESSVKSDHQGPYPIFEVKDTAQAVLILNGYGLWDRIWAYVLIDRSTLSVLNIEFDHIGETPGLGARITDKMYAEQFIGSTINLIEDSYSMTKTENDSNDDPQKIDILSGATITSKGVLRMMNDDFKKYYDYLLPHE